MFLFAGSLEPFAHVASPLDTLVRFSFIIIKYNIASQPIAIRPKTISFFGADARKIELKLRTHIFSSRQINGGARYAKCAHLLVG